VDVTGTSGVTYDFQWGYLDKTQPPGRDKVEGGLRISARGGRFQVMDVGHATMLWGPSSHRPDPAPDPRCSGRDAWKVAVGSGLPDNAVTSMRY
jgi:hypothetical protein